MVDIVGLVIHCAGNNCWAKQSEAIRRIGYRQSFSYNEYIDRTLSVEDETAREKTGPRPRIQRRATSHEGKEAKLRTNWSLQSFLLNTSQTFYLIRCLQLGLYTACIHLHVNITCARAHIW